MSNSTDNETKKLLLCANKRTVNLALTISSKRSRLYFSKDLIRVLGGPPYICIKVNRNYDSILVTPCDSKMYLSFKVPENLFLIGHTHMEVSSIGFVRELLFRNGLELEETYTMKGIYFEDKNAVVFRVGEAERHDASVSENAQLDDIG